MIQKYLRYKNFMEELEGSYHTFYSSMAPGSDAVAHIYADVLNCVPDGMDFLAGRITAAINLLNGYQTIRLKQGESQKAATARQGMDRLEKLRHRLDEKEEGNDGTVSALL